MPDYASTQRDARVSYLSAYPFESRNNWLGIALACTSSSGTSSRTAMVGSGSVVTICNTGTVTAFVALGTSSVTATTACYPILPGTKEILSVSEGESMDYAAGITASGTTTLSIHRGYGN